MLERGWHLAAGVRTIAILGEGFFDNFALSFSASQVVTENENPSTGSPLARRPEVDADARPTRSWP